MTHRHFPSLALTVTLALPMMALGGCAAEEELDDDTEFRGPTTLRARPLRRKGSSSGANPLGTAPPAWASSKCWMTELSDYHVVLDYNIIGNPSSFATWYDAALEHGPIVADAWTVIRDRDYLLYWEMALGVYSGTEPMFSYNEPNPDAYCDPATEVPVLGLALVESRRLGAGSSDPFVIAGSEHQVIWGTVSCDPIPAGWSGDPMDLIDTVVPLQDTDLEVNQECEEGFYMNAAHDPEFPLGADDVPHEEWPAEGQFLGSWLGTRLGQGN